MTALIVIGYCAVGFVVARIAARIVYRLDTRDSVRIFGANSPSVDEWKPSGRRFSARVGLAVGAFWPAAVVVGVVLAIGCALSKLVESGLK